MRKITCNGDQCPEVDGASKLTVVLLDNSEGVPVENFEAQVSISVRERSMSINA